MGNLNIFYSSCSCFFCCSMIVEVRGLVLGLTRSLARSLRLPPAAASPSFRAALYLIFPYEEVPS